MDAWTLFLVGALAGVALWLGLVGLPGGAAPREALLALAASRGARLAGDGRRVPLTVLGVVRGRPFTVTWQRPAGGAEVLLVGVDCAADLAEVLPPPEAARDTGEALTAATDAALVTRWVRPRPDLWHPGRMDAIVDALAELAESLEATHGTAPDPDGPS